MPTSRRAPVRSLQLIAVACLAALLSIVAAPVLAEDDTADYGRRGPSGRLGAVVGFENAQILTDINAVLPAILAAAPGLPPGALIDQALLQADPMLGASLGLGYRVHPRFGVAAAFDWMRGDVDLLLTVTAPALLGTQTTKRNVGTWTAWSLTADARGYLATGVVQPYAAVGLGVMSQELAFTGVRGTPASGSATAFVPRFGGGLDIYLTRHVALNIDAGYLLATGDLDGSDATSLRLGVVGRY